MKIANVRYKFLPSSLRTSFLRRTPSIIPTRLPAPPPSSTFSHCQFFSSGPNREEEEKVKEQNDRNEEGERSKEQYAQLLQQLEEDVALNLSYTYWQRIKKVYNFVKECGTEEAIAERIQAYEDGGVM